MGHYSDEESSYYSNDETTAKYTSKKPTKKTRYKNTQKYPNKWSTFSAQISDKKETVYPSKNENNNNNVVVSNPRPVISTTEEAFEIHRMACNAIYNNETDTLRDILSQEYSEAEEALLMKHFKGGFCGIDLIAEALGVGYDAKYKPEILKVILSINWVRKELVGHRYLHDVTALHIAYQRNRQDAIEQLENAGFNKAAIDDQFITAEGYRNYPDGYKLENYFKEPTPVPAEPIFPAITKTSPKCNIM